MVAEKMQGLYEREGLHANKCAVVTGGACGIGSATAKMLAKNGARVIIVDINKEECEKVANDILRLGGTAHCLEVDITSLEDIKQLVDFASEEYGTVDILANCAGVSRLTNLLDISEDEWDFVLDVNLKGVFLVSQKILELMIKNKTKGSIVNVSSLAGKVGGLVVGAHYAASKAGVIALTKTMARFAAQYGINVNALAPGAVRTEMIETWPKEVMDKFISNVPLGRVAEPEEVSAIICFLVSPEARYITGEVVDVNGGALMD